MRRAGVGTVLDQKLDDIPVVDHASVLKGGSTVCGGVDVGMMLNQNHDKFVKPFAGVSAFLCFTDVSIT